MELLLNIFLHQKLNIINKSHSFCKESLFEENQFLMLIGLTFWYETSAKPPEFTISIYRVDKRGARTEGTMIPFPSVLPVENVFMLELVAGF